MAGTNGTATKESAPSDGCKALRTTPAIVEHWLKRRDTSACRCSEILKAISPWKFKAKTRQLITNRPNLV